MMAELIQTQTSLEMDTLSASIIGLSEAIDEIALRLQGVMRPNEQPDGEVPSEEQLVCFAGHIRSHRLRVEAQTIVLRSMLSRLEI